MNSSVNSLESIDIAFFGTLILSATLVAASYTVAIALFSCRGRYTTLAAVRYGTYATCSFIALSTFVLAYAFQVHDFHIRYVTRYSDRSMSWPFLLAALWGGQDGSLLSWTFTLSLCVAVCSFRLKDRLLRLQPYIYLTLNSIIAFFVVVMLFAANPFAGTLSGAPPDGQGLNPLLHNYWMLIHPPILYVGMVSWAIPFAFVIAALITSELNGKWIQEVRGWVIFAWITLAMGNVLGMIWSYEELGWGGYWGWDPVENASFIPMLAGTAYLHSALLQMRRRMFKVWNVSLLCLAFFLTVFGTFLTRSGLISSVHAFARSGMGIYFVVFMGFISVVSIGLISWRLPRLRSKTQIDSWLSLDFTFWLTNLLLMAMLFFVVIVTMLPLISEMMWGETVSVGPSFYNRWIVPLGLILLALLGFGTIFSWHRTHRSQLWRKLLIPTVSAGSIGVLHLMTGDIIGYPAVVEQNYNFDTIGAKVVTAFFAWVPLTSTVICAFVVSAHLQQMLGDAVRSMRASNDSLWVSLYRFVSKVKRRYGAYVVHLGLVSMCFGFTGSVYDSDSQKALLPNQSLKVGRYQVRFDGSRIEEKIRKRVLVADMTVLQNGKPVARLQPAKFLYEKPAGTTTTEVSIRSSVREDIYAILDHVDFSTGMATFRVIVRPFVAWIWIGAILMLLGSAMTLLPKRGRE